MTAPDDTNGAPQGIRDASSPMDAETCLHVLSLLLDERPVDPALAARARAHAEAHPELAAVERDWRAMREALASAPARTTREGFTERVLAAWAGERLAPVGTLRFARRLALAAGLALAVTLGFDMARPATLQADQGVQRAPHAVDHFRDGPFDADDIVGGLRARLRDAGFAPRGAVSAGAR